MTFVRNAYVITHTDTHCTCCYGVLCSNNLCTLHIATVMCPCRALLQVVEKCGKAFEPYLTSDLVQLVFTCLSHTNRFVRETGYRVIAAIITIPGQCVCVWGVCVCVCVFVCVCVCVCVCVYMYICVFSVSMCFM